MFFSKDVVCEILEGTISGMIHVVRSLSFAIGAVAMLAVSTTALAVPSALDVRVGVHSDKTRLVVDLSEQVAFNLFTLADPYRVVVDLPEISWQTSIDALRRSGGLVTSLRFGHFKAGQSRIVLDLSRPARVEGSFVLPGQNDQPSRLVLDLKAVDRDTFMASLQPPAPVASEPAVAPVPILKPKRRQTGKFIVVVDPGHGGVDPGAIGLSGGYEKNVTLSFARQLRGELLKLGGFDVRLTRDRDVFIPLRGRVEFARRVEADLFISIHADSIGNRNVRGGGIYTLSETASDKEAAALAAKENRVDVIAGVDLNQHDDDVASILIDLTQRETMNYSARFASALVPELSQHIRMRRKPHRFAGFRVLKAPDVPSVLIELGYLSNREDERMLRSSRSRTAIAASIARAVKNYADRLR
jgi:N-acetylmuramoyl-L-alanine amidase